MKKEQLEQYRLALEIEERKLNGEDVEWQGERIDMNDNHYEWEVIVNCSPISCVNAGMKIRLTPKLTQQEQWVKDGKKVEWRDGRFNWVDYDKDSSPALNNPTYAWRIKPNIKRRVPLGCFDLPVGTRLRNDVSENWEGIVIERDEKEVHISHYVISYETLMNYKMWNGREWVECSRIEYDV